MSEYQTDMFSWILWGKGMIFLCGPVLGHVYRFGLIKTNSGALLAVSLNSKSVYTAIRTLVRTKQADQDPWKGCPWSASKQTEIWKLNAILAKDI